MSKSLESLFLEAALLLLALAAFPVWVSVLPYLQPAHIPLPSPLGGLHASLPIESPVSAFLLADPNYNRCDIPEESWAGCESDVAYASYVPGSIIWAKQYGYPW